MAPAPPVNSGAHAQPVAPAASLAVLRQRVTAAMEGAGGFPLSASMHGRIRAVSTLEFRDMAGAPAAEFGLALCMVDDSGNKCDAVVSPALLLQTVGVPEV